MAASDPLASLVPPRQLGRFQVLERLGAGGMAEVLVCIRHGAAGFARAVAVKRVLPFLAKDPGFRTMLRREAAIAATADHPNCVRIDELEEHEGELLLSMELLYGLDAAELLRRSIASGRTVPVDVALRLGVDALRGLHHVHGLTDGEGRPLGVVHRDISPHNLFVTDSGHTKILDFGIATAVEAVDGDTMTGALKGKFRYMAPEQVSLRPLDARTDVWAMAVSLFELIAGRPLFEGALMDVLDALRVGPTSIDWGRAPGIPVPLRSTLERALAPDPQARTPSAQAFADAIEAEHEVASHRAVARIVEELASEDVAKLRRTVALALRTGQRLGDAQAPGAEGPRGDASVNAHGTTAPGKRAAADSQRGRAIPPPAPSRDARDTVADETLAPLALLDARDTLREEIESPLAAPTSTPPRPRWSAAPSRPPTPPPRPATPWATVGAIFLVGAILGWALGELVF